MAQYGHNWYGTSYYGETNAFSGWYETREVFTDELLKNTVTINMRAALPSATYAPNAPEVQQLAGTWAYDATGPKISSSSTNAKLYFAATCDKLTIKYEQRTIAAKVNIKVTTTQVGQTPVINNYTLNTQAATVNTNMTYDIPVTAFAQHQVEITMAADSPAGANFNFKGFTARTANLTIESRARLNETAWPSPIPEAAYTKLTTTVTPISGSTDYMVTAVTPNYSGKNNIQFKVYLASSDNETTPEVKYIEMVAGDTDNRTEDGKWTAVFNMSAIAAVAGVSFSKVEEVVWTEEVPDVTTLTIRSQSTINNTEGEWNLEPITVPYRQKPDGTPYNRIRLKEGYNSGWIDTPVNAPAFRPYVTTVEWTKWDDQSYLPPDNGGVTITYDFISPQKDNTTNPYVRILNPMDKAERSLAGNRRLRNFDNVIRITMRKPNSTKQTPVVDYIHLESKMYYEQDVETVDQEFSSVDFNNTGKGVMLDTNLAAFRNRYQIPAEAGLPITYKLIDETRRPQDVMLYLDSEKTKAVRTNTTTTLSNKVWAEAKPRNNSAKTGLLKHYQYGGGQVKFPLKDEIQMAPTFTPSLNNGLRYRYHLQTGWPQQYYTSIAGDTLELIANNYGKTQADFLSINPSLSYNNDGTLVAGQRVKIPNDSVNNDVIIYWKSTTNERTSKSAHNAVLEGSGDMSNDSVVAEVSNESIYGWVDWVSEEKIYDGVINPNDIRREYKRTHTLPTSGTSAQVEYIAVAGDTYKKIAQQFKVYEEDVRRLNGVTVADEQPVVGQRVLVPSQIVLPSIHPKAIVDDSPYKVTIVYNSVKKKDGKILSEDVITEPVITVTYKSVTMRSVEIVRGTIENGKDLLQHARVTQILQARSDVRTFNPGLDFKQTDNYIDWSQSTTAGAEPAAGTTYFVDYICEIPATVTVQMDTTYLEQGGVDRIWRSPEVKEYNGICSPGQDFVVELEPFANWLGLPDSAVEDIQYVVEDNDIWVKTWVEERKGKWYLIGSLQDRVPKDNWFPTIKTGYYYLGKEEYYLFNEPIILEPTEKEIPIAKNVEYVPGKFENAAQLQEGSTNIIRNSGFDVMNTTQTVFKLTF